MPLRIDIPDPDLDGLRHRTRLGRVTAAGWVAVASRSAACADRRSAGPAGSTGPRSLVLGGSAPLSGLPLAVSRAAGGAVVEHRPTWTWAELTFRPATTGAAPTGKDAEALVPPWLAASG